VSRATALGAQPSCPPQHALRDSMHYPTPKAQGHQPPTPLCGYYPDENL